MRIRLMRTQKNFQFPFPGSFELCANALFFKVGLGSDDKDDYSDTGDCICVIKRTESSEQIPVDEPVPLEYAGHRLAIFERHVEKGGKDHWGIIVNEGEIDDMLRIGLIRAGHKGYKETP